MRIAVKNKPPRAPRRDARKKYLFWGAGLPHLCALGVLGGKIFLAGVITFLSVGSLHSQEYVSCYLNGQLGNQMFQIAAALSFALDHGCEARFPNIAQARDAPINAPYILHRLNQESFPPDVQFEAYHDRIHSNIYAPIPYEKGKNLCIYGHYESEKYFLPHAPLIRELFAPTPEILAEIRAKYGHLLQNPTVAVHVRTFIPDHRDPRFKGIGGSGWGYFTQAMNLFPPNTHFLVFSDAMQWTKLRFPRSARKVTFIEDNPAHIDFYLMMLCDHQIISPESTFSWWAAWLNPNPHKKVIIADTWNDLTENDTIPDGWIKLKKTDWHF
ncbi:MAG TPA: alpha-1,2-fucosyltransferase [Chlamydiales bacterium]|nr:alpha-1,2-fucosyltransferase [Chlamydiales bacterium]